MRRFWLCIAIIPLLLSACASTHIDTPQNTGTDEPSVSLVRTPDGVSTEVQATSQPTIPTTPTLSISESGATVPPSPTPAEQITSNQPCAYASNFVKDVTIQDGSILPTGRQVEKIWRIQNTGTCAWEAGTSLVHIKADRFDTTGKVSIPFAQPGEEIDVKFTFTTPGTPGVYESYWRLENVHGELFGGVLYMNLTTSTSATDFDTIAPSATAVPTEIPSLTPTQKAIQAATPTALPTLTPTAIPNQGCIQVDPQFMGVLSQASMLRFDVGCAMGTVQYSTGTVQEFWTNINNQDAHQRFRSLLLKINALETIYVLVGKDSLTYEAAVITHNEKAFTLADSQYVCEHPQPPSGYAAPQNELTKVWCDKRYWKVIGWTRQGETPAEFMVQTTAKGALIKISTLPATVYYLALNLDSELGTVQMGR